MTIALTTQIQLAEITGIPNATISRIERGALRNGDLQRKCHQRLETLQREP